MPVMIDNRWNPGMPRRSRISLWIATCVALSGCAVGPDYEPPAIQPPQSWAAPLPAGTRTLRLIDWWQRFNDPVLMRLLTGAEEDSPTLAKAWANIAKARANAGISRADGMPSLTADGSGQRGKQLSATGAGKLSNTLSGSLDASWELDLWGKVRRNTEAANARVEARTDDWHDARVSLAAEVADTYVQYSACRLLAEAYADAAQSQHATAKAVASAVGAGFTSTADGALARASAASAQATLVAQQAECDVLVKSLVALTGIEESALRQELEASSRTLPQPAAFAVESVPAALLFRRPDLASAERELAAASAEIGAAEAARYPTLSLSGSITRSGADLGSLMTTWLMGATASLPLFDGGKRTAAVDAAQAAYDVRLAEYRDGIRIAVKEVEQALVRLDGATRRTADSQVAARGYRQYFDSTDRNWRAGGASLLNREEARRNALSAEISFITVQRDQVQYWIALYKALGGGWGAEAFAESAQTGENM